MRIFQTVIILELLLISFLHAAYDAHKPSWAGYVIWGGDIKSQDVLIVDPSRMIIRGSGSDPEMLCKHVIGNASCAGIRKIYWRLNDNSGHVLYDSRETNSIFRLSNLDLDFSKINYPRNAYKVTQELGLELVFVADDKYLEEAQNKFSPVKVISSSEIPESHIVTELDMLNIYRWKVSKLAAGNLSNKTMFFRKHIIIDKQLAKAAVCITAKKEYELYIDGRLIGKDGEWWGGETYDVTELFSQGNHVVAVEVKPDEKTDRGLLVNMKLVDENGMEEIISTDTGWLCSDDFTVEWNKLEFNDKNWGKPFLVGYDGCIPWFRLTRPWRNETLLLPSSPEERPLGALSVSVSENVENADKMIDSFINNRSVWYSEVPCEIVIDLKKPAFIGEVRIYSGNTEYANNNSGSLSIKKYKIDAFIENKWIVLVPATEALPFRGQRCEDFFVRHKIKSKAYEKIKLVVLESYDTGRRVHCPDKPCVKNRIVYIREVSLCGSEK